MERLWTKNFILICMANLMLFISFYFLLPTLPIFVTEKLGGNNDHVGYIIGILSLTAVLVRPVAGHLFDSFSRKKIQIVALIAFALIVSAYLGVTTLAMLLLLRVFHGISWGMVTTGSGTMVADIVPASRRGEGLGYYGLSNTLAMALGPSLGLYIVQQAGFPVLFLGSLFFAIATLVAVVMITDRSVKEEQQHPSPASPGSSEKQQPWYAPTRFFEPKVLDLAGIMLFISTGYGGIVSFITIYGPQIGVHNGGLYFFVYAATLLLVRPIAGKIYDRQGPAKVMFLGFSGLIIAFLLLYLAQGAFLFFASAVWMGIGFGITQPNLMAMAIQRVSPFRRGKVNGTILSALDFGIGIGAILLGMFSARYGLDMMYLLCALITLVPFGWFYLREGRSKPRAQHE
ncbi:MFS transporter [Heliophilum fasciatum]|nr:MFS transporter [Heliophilum fasciatum]